jgi:hypothetical protein
VKNDLRLIEPDTEFDPWNDDLMRDLCGNFAQPIKELLLSLRQIEIAEGSFGVRKEAAFDMLRPQLSALKKACEEEFRQL